AGGRGATASHDRRAPGPPAVPGSGGEAKDLITYPQPAPTFGDDIRQGRCYYRGLAAHRAGMIDQKARNRVAQLGLASCSFYAIDELGLGRLRYRTPLCYRPF